METQVYPEQAMLQTTRGPVPAAKETTRGLRLIVAHEDEGFIARIRQQFAQLGWDVYPAHSPAEVRQLARELSPGVIILPTQFQDESGWLTCAKLVQDHPGHKVILVGPYSTPDLQRYTTFVGGAALVRLDTSIRSLVEEVCHAAQTLVA